MTYYADLRKWNSGEGEMDSFQVAISEVRTESVTTVVRRLDKGGVKTGDKPEGGLGAVTEPCDQQTFTLQEWDKAHPRWEEFVQCLEQTAPEQSPFVLGEYSRHLLCYLCVALQNEQVVGFLRFGIQPIGPEAHCPPLVLNGIPLTEAKIHAFAVREERRGQGIGTALQRWVIRRAKELGCFQVASYSSYGRDANYHIKLSLGFGVQPEVHGDNEQGAYFIMPLMDNRERDESTQ